MDQLSDDHRIQTQRQKDKTTGKDFKSLYLKIKFNFRLKFKNIVGAEIRSNF